MKKVLVTGAGGYIGSTLTRMLLDTDFEVLGVDRFFFGQETLPKEGNGLSILQADIRELDEKSFNGIDYVIDLAALSNDPVGELDPSKTWSINHRGRARVARLAKSANVKRYILPSSCSIYGFRDELIDENSPINPLTTYAKANHKAEVDVLPLADDNFCVVVIRQATVFGLSYRMRFDLAINGMVKGFFQNGKIPLMRDGNQWRPFVHVKDTSRAMIKLLEAPVEKINGQIFNVGSNEQNVQIKPLARMVTEAMEVPFEFEWYGDPDHRSYKVSFDKIHDTLGYETEYSIHDGVREVVEALRDGGIDPEDPKTITLNWYKHLLSVGVEF